MRDGEMVAIYKKLQVWRKAQDLGSRIHNVTRYFPRDKDVFLSDQIEREADRLVLAIEKGALESDCTKYIECFKDSYDVALHLRRNVLQSQQRGYIGKNAFADIEKAIDDVLVAITRYIRMLEYINSSLDHNRAYSYSLLFW
jgi:four helix bundle protein